MQLLMRIALSAVLAFTAIFAGFVPSSIANAAVYAVSGHVTDASTGAPLDGVVAVVKELSFGGGNSGFIYEGFGQ
ncbi:MAG: hypothetical protein NVS9B6_09630 [Candidatus Limnocylindrales bacterium]